jgi:phage shock protein PspC (stress-responsive transcriptional regulator)
MTEPRTTDPKTGMDKLFAALRGIGVRRRTDDKWIAGVCSGVADRLGVDPVIVRGATVLLFMLGGIGIPVYLVAWVLLPNDKDELAVERALRDGDGGSIVLIVIAAFMVFGGSWWGRDSGWGFPWGGVFAVFLFWWLFLGRHRPAPGQRVNTRQPGMPYSAEPSPAPYSARPSPTASRPMVPRRPRRRSGGPLMALLAIGVALVTYGSLSWLGTKLDWTDHTTIALAGSLAAIGVLLVVLGLVGWRAGFVTFLAVVLAVTAWSSSVLPAGIDLSGRVGEVTWSPTSVVPDAKYHLGAGDAVLDLKGLPRAGLSKAGIRASVGAGELTVLVPEGLTVEVRGNVGMGEILSPDDVGDGQGGTDVSRPIVIGDGPTEVVVDAGVGLGQLTVVKE